MNTTWTINRHDEKKDPIEEVWDWSAGPVPVRELASTRDVLARATAPNVAALAFSTIVGAHLPMESGLEHDLLRDLDRVPEITWLVAQPVHLKFANGDEHTPDLLSVDEDDHVVLWDVRPQERQDEAFQVQVRETRDACAEVGWEHRVFDGFPRARRLNLLWLHSFRRPPNGLDGARRRIQLSLAVDSELGTLLSLPDPDGTLRYSLWHLIWAKDLQVDETLPIQLHSRVWLAS